MDSIVSETFLAFPFLAVVRAPTKLDNNDQ